MGIGRILGAAAPIAAGYFGGPAMAGFTGGATSGAIAAGALTGAGIAALTGQDPLMGGITGGLGGMGGGAFRTAADATKLASAGVGGGTTAGVNSLIQNPEFISPFTPAGTFGSQTMNAGLTGASMGGGAFMPNQALAMQNNINATNKLMGPNQLNPVYQNKLAPNLAFKATPDAVDPTALQGGYESLGTNMSKGVESAKAAFDEPGEFLKNLGDGNKTIGAAKAGITASGPIMAAFEPEVQTFDELRTDKYDPNRALDLSMDTGIGSALKRDTGLRLLAEGGEVKSGGFSEAELGYTPEGFKPTTGLGEGETPGIDAYAAGHNVPPGTELTAEGKYIYPMIPSYYYSAYPRRAFEPLPTGGLDSLQRKAKGMAEGGEITDDMRSSYGITPQYRNVGYGMGARTQERVPVMGVVDVGGKFVSNPKGDITDIQFEEKYLQNQVDAEKNQNQQSGGMGPQFGPGVPAQIPEAAQKALTNLAGGIASAQRSQAANQIDRLGGLAGGGYLETGGRIGDGMSDDIKARINNSQEARLSDGEFVVPADVVSHLGNGSSDAGAKRLYSMMDKVRRARTGTKKQGKEINPERYMPA